MKTKTFTRLSAVALAIAVIAATGCKKTNNNNADGGYDPLQMSRDSLAVAVANQDSLLMLMTEITNSMNEIKSLENILSSTDGLQGETVDRRQQIRDDIVALQTALIERRQRLASLEERLNKSDSNNAHLKQAITALKAQIEEQEGTIGSLRSQLAKANIYIDQLTQDVDSLNTAIAVTTQEREEAVKENIDLTNELNICYYCIGSKSELKEHKVIETGFLRKTKIMPEDFEHNYFTVADKRKLSILPLHSKKAKVLTNQPTTSYEISTDGSGMKTLVIKDSEKFWGVTNYVVVQID